MKIHQIVLHCSDSPDRLDKIDVKDIRRWHTDPPPKGRGWRDVAYHYIVTREPEVQIGRPHNGDSVLIGAEIGAHAFGHNEGTLGVCWVGRDRPTVEQREMLLNLMCKLLDQYSLPVEAVVGHYELDAKKDCPNIDMPGFREEIRVQQPIWKKEQQ